MIAKVLTILLITLVYGLIYASIHKADPTAFGFEDGLFDPFYFSFTTMSSVGYGDYSPKTRIAKARRHVSADYSHRRAYQYSRGHSARRRWFECSKS